MKKNLLVVAAITGAWLLSAVTVCAQIPPIPSFLSGPSSTSPGGKNISHQANSIYGSLPLYFEPNEGQADPGVKFISQGVGYTLFLTSQETVLVLGGNSSPAKQGFPRGKALKFIPPPPIPLDVLRMRLVGAGLNPSTEGLEKLPGTSNYFIGNNPSQWRTNIPQYAKVLVPSVYPGIDLVYYGNQRQLEYDFVAKPGADPKAIRWSYEGAQGAEVNTAGELVLKTSGKSVVFKAPVLYQERGGVRQPVNGRYKQTGTNEVGFEVDSYDATKPLVIDPVLDYSTYLGGSGHDGAWGIAIDAAGDAYVIGHTISANFPVTNAFQPVIGGTNYNAIVAKLNPAGTALIYSTFLGGTGNEDVEFPYGIAVDGGGNCYVAGPTVSKTGAPGSNDFPITSGAYQTTSPGGADAFVTELNASGSALVYSTYFGGTGDDFCFGLALDPAGGVYVTGQSFSTDLPTTGAGGSGAYQSVLKASSGNCNGFVAKLDMTKTGTASLVYSTYLGGSSIDTGIDIAADPSGNAYVVGWGNSPDFPVTPGAPQTVNQGGYDAFITKLNPSGTGLVYSTLLGGSGAEQVGGIDVDAGGNAYVAGDTTSTDFPTTSGAPQTVLSGRDNAFVTKLNPSGTAWVYSTYLGGNNYDIGYDVKVNGSGEAYVVGSSASSNFPTTPDAYQSTYIGGGNAMGFLTHLDALGTGLVYSTYFGGSGGDTLAAVALDGNGGIYLAGETISTDLPTTSGAPQTVFGGPPSDGFIAKFGPSPTSTPTITNSPTITKTPMITNTSTITYSPTQTSTPTATYTSTNSPTNTSTNTATNTPSQTTTAASTSMPTLTPIPTNTPIVINTPSYTPTYSPTATATPTTVTVNITAGPSSPPNSTQLPGTANLPVIQVLVNNPGTSPVTLTSLTITDSGSSSAGITGITLYNNGTPLGTTVFTGPTAAFNGITVVIPAGGSVTLQVNAGFSATAPTGANYQFSLSGAAGTNGQPVGFSGLPFTGAAITITATPTPTSTPTGPFSLYPNPTNGSQPVYIHIPGLTIPSDVKVRIFTTAFRKVQETLFQRQPVGVDVSISLTDRWGTPLASGLYYVVVLAMPPTGSGQNQTRHVGKMVILR